MGKGQLTFSGPGIAGSDFFSDVLKPKAESLYTIGPIQTEADRGEFIEK